MPAAKNLLKSKLEAGQTCYGTWLNLLSPISAGIAGDSGLDWCLIDAEHGPYDLDKIAAQARAIDASAASACVRIPHAEVWMVKQVLDLGLQTVLVPMIETVKQAQEMAKAMRYPPDGIRGMAAPLVRASGYNAVVDYAVTSNPEMCLIVQVETPLGIENLDAICAVDGVDGVFIGPADLAMTMGHVHNFNAPEVVAAIEGAIQRINNAGKYAGIIAFNYDDVARYARLGVKFIGVGSDVSIFADSIRKIAAESREINLDP